MANPTTNYGWPMPTSTDLVTDLPADFAAFGQPVDTSLKALNPETTLGDISYRSATANTNTRLAIGSTGNVLTVAGGVPTWAAPVGGGKVLQVVNATYGTSITSTSTTFADTNLTATITPTSATSKVLVLVNHVGAYKTTTNTSMAVKLLRGATEILRIEDMAGYTDNTSNSGVGSISTSYLDSPATTSATTYKTTFANRSGTGSVILQAQYSGGLSGNSTITLMEIGA